MDVRLLGLALVNDRVLDIRLWVYGLQHVEFFFCGEDICLIMALDVICMFILAQI